MRRAITLGGAKGTRTPDPLLANHRQTVHPRPSPQVTVPGRTSGSVRVRTCCGTSALYLGSGSRDGPPGHHPGHQLAGDLRDELIIAVVVEHRDAFALRDSGGQQVRETNRPDLAAAP